MRVMLRRSLLPALLLAMSSAPGAEQRLLPSSTQDLQYGEALFHYYQQDWFNSIIRLQVAKTQQALPNHASEAELLLGGLDLSYGLRDEATRIFENLLAEHASDDLTRNRAWYYLAKISWQRGDPDAALAALDHLEGDMSNGTRAESALLQGLVLIRQQRYAEAIAALAAARTEKVWTPYLAYNLGIAQLRNGQLAEGAQTLAHMGEMSGPREELRALRDKANLALGYSYLQQGDAQLSRATLQRVRLQGPMSNKALLGTGWADAEAERYGHALVPWRELGSREATDPAVQEAMLATPYAMTKMKLHGEAVAQYNEAINALYDEKARLDASISAIRNGELLEILQRQDLRSGSGWLQQLTLDTETPALRYQLTLMASHDFQEAIKNYRDLLVLRNNLENWSESIEAFDDMLAARRQQYAAHEPAAARGLRDNRRQQLQARYRELSSALQQVEADDDAVALARPDELAKWQQLQDIKAQLARLPASGKVEKLQRKQARLEGVLLWDLSSQYRPRLWEAKRELDRIEQLLGESDATLESLGATRSLSPAEFDALRARTNTHRKTIAALLARTHDNQLAQGRLLEQLAVAELQQQQHRIDVYVVQARFSLAQTYDLALHARQEVAQ
jgi:outer membrane protein assembly factor BamD (BamD/ComL family)